jgi:hypothetical protein
LEHVRGKQWRAEWIEPNPGLVDYVEAQHLLVRWSESAAFVRDETAKRAIRADNARNGYDEDTPVTTALHCVFDNIGDKVSFYRGVLSGSADALERVRQRAKLERISSSGLQYVDRHGMTHVPFADTLKLAMAFCAAEPATAQTIIEPTERNWTREAATAGDDSMRAMLSEYRAAWALIRQWAALSPGDALRAEVQRLERLVLDAVYALQRAGIDDVAHRLRRELGERNEPRWQPKKRSDKRDSS